MCNFIQNLERRQMFSSSVSDVFPADAVTLLGQHYFVAADTAHGQSLWQSDGTISGTSLVHSLTPAGAAIVDCQILNAGNHIVILFNRGNDEQVWGSDGTAGGTHLVAEFKSAANTIPTAAAAVINGKVDFVIQSQGPKQFGSTLWSTDGTLGGTTRLDALYPTASTGANYSNGLEMSVVGGRLFITSGTHLWSSDGTTAGSVEIVASDEGGWSLHTIAGARVAALRGGATFFDNHSQSFWTTDGTTAGTHIVKHLTGSADNFAVLGKTAIFTIVNASTGERVLWSTDGTANGTVALATLPGEFATAAGASTGRYFVRTIMSDSAGDGGSSGASLLITDGTAAGTRVLPLDAGTLPTSEPVAAGNSCFFMANGVNNSVALWQTDGTADGTRIVRDLTGTLPAGHRATLSVDDEQLRIRQVKIKLVMPLGNALPIDGPAHASMSLGSDGTLRILGSRSGDSIKIYNAPDGAGRIVVSLNGAKQTFAASHVKRINVSSFGGDDVIAVSEKYGKFSIRTAVFAGSGNDQVFGGGERDTLSGGSGADTLNGGNNDDLITGDAGDDAIFAGNGNDTLSGGAGIDTLSGGAGNDCLATGDSLGQDQLDGGSGADLFFAHARTEMFSGGKRVSSAESVDQLLLV